jgi:hypothetical protein
MDFLKRLTQPSSYAGLSASMLGGVVVEAAPLFSSQWWLALAAVMGGIFAALRDERKT